MARLEGDGDGDGDITLGLASKGNGLRGVFGESAKRDDIRIGRPLGVKRPRLVVRNPPLAGDIASSSSPR